MTVLVFHDAGKEQGADHETFQTWISKNAIFGWYLNERPDGSFMLHAAKCQHRIDHGGSYEDEGQSSTTYRKICSLSRTKLIDWAKEHGKEPVRCASCS